MWRIQLMGTFALWSEKSGVINLPEKPGLLVGLLAWKGEEIPRYRLAEQIWPYAGNRISERIGPGDRALNLQSLSQALSVIRRAMTPQQFNALFIVKPQALRLRPEMYETDFAPYRRLLKRGQHLVREEPEQTEKALALFREAARCGGGDFLPAKAPLDWLTAARERYQSEHCEALKRLAELEEAAGERDNAMFALREAAQRRPQDSEAQAALAKLCARPRLPAAPTGRVLPLFTLAQNHWRAGNKAAAVQTAEHCLNEMKQECFAARIDWASSQEAAPVYAVALSERGKRREPV